MTTASETAAAVELRAAGNARVSILACDVARARRVLELILRDRFIPVSAFENLMRVMRVFDRAGELHRLRAQDRHIVRLEVPVVDALLAGLTISTLARNTDLAVAIMRLGERRRDKRVIRGAAEQRRCLDSFGRVGAELLARARDEAYGAGRPNEVLS